MRKWWVHGLAVIKSCVVDKGGEVLMVLGVEDVISTGMHLAGVGL